MNNNNDLMAIAEGFLFIAGKEGLTLEMLSMYLKLEKKKPKVLEIMEQLQNKLNNDLQSGLSVIKLGDFYRLTTKKDHYEYYQVLQEQPMMRLSQAALETLAIIAYNQPVTKPRIEEIRGVNCDAMITKLKGLSFIEEVGRSELPGRPILYSITNEFMNHFQIESLSQLPELPSFNLTEEDQKIYHYGDN